jgi:DNA-3-methyladenine glycosylase
MALLPRSFYLRPDVVRVAIELLGKQIFTRMDGTITSGIICETEAYAGISDKASHAYGGRRTKRTEIIDAIGGTAFIYLCYGVHSLCNVVTNSVGIPHAVLIRGIVPVTGSDFMLLRAGLTLRPGSPGIGPGKVTKLLGIHYSHTGLDLVNKPGDKTRPAIWIEDSGILIQSGMITTGTRVGVDYAAEDAFLPYRFSVSESRF